MMMLDSSTIIIGIFTILVPVFVAILKLVHYTLSNQIKQEREDRTKSIDVMHGTMEEHRARLERCVEQEQFDQLERRIIETMSNIIRATIAEMEVRLMRHLARSPKSRERHDDEDDGK